MHNKFWLCCPGQVLAVTDLLALGQLQLCMWLHSLKCEIGFLSKGRPFGYWKPTKGSHDLDKSDCIIWGWICYASNPQLTVIISILQQDWYNLQIPHIGWYPTGLEIATRMTKSPNPPYRTKDSPVRLRCFCSKLNNVCPCRSICKTGCVSGQNQPPAASNIIMGE